MNSNPKVFTNKHYNTPGHAHDLTFSVYRRKMLFSNPVSCRMLLHEMKQARTEFSFHIWAYVIMPNHVHLLIWPLNADYDIGTVKKAIKGRMAKRYIAFHKENGILEKLSEYTAIEKGMQCHRLWQRGGGFDRNLWNGKPVHDAIAYIEANPVRKRLVYRPEDYQWSSAYTRAHGVGLMPDVFRMPVALPNAQNQKVDVL